MSGKLQWESSKGDRQDAGEGGHAVIRFVDLRPAEIASIRFAFWDTVRDHFIQGTTNQQGWGTWAEFLEDINPTSRSHIARLRGLAPAWVDTALTQDEEEGVSL